MSSQTAIQGELAYRQWLAAGHSPAHSRRTAEREAAFFLPHLRPGMSLLDAGCGPGSITLGLARAVAPGEVLGIDINPRAIEAARASASAAGLTNIRFEVLDLHELALQHQRFDAVFAHAVLQHVPDAARSVRWLKSVLNEGGVAGLADADYGGSVIAPLTPALRRALRLMDRARRESGGDIHVGAKLRQHMASAGFTDVSGSASAMCEGSTQATRMTGEFSASYLEAPEFARHATEVGWVLPAALAAMAAAWRAWGEHPGAYWARFWCHAVGRA